MTFLGKGLVESFMSQGTKLEHCHSNAFFLVSDLFVLKCFNVYDVAEKIQRLIISKFFMRKTSEIRGLHVSTN